MTRLSNFPLTEAASVYMQRDNNPICYSQQMIEYYELLNINSFIIILYEYIDRYRYQFT